MTVDEFVNKYNGKYVEYHSYSAGAKNQCVDLANQWIDEGLGLKAIIGTNAIDFPGKAVEMGWEWIPNFPEGMPDPGDLIIYEGQYGHIDIALGGCTIFKIQAFSQNYPTGSPCIIRTSNYLKPKCIGWLHPKENMNCLINNDTEGKKLYDKLVGNSTKWDETVKYIWTDKDPNTTPSKDVTTHIAGKQSRITDLEKQLGNSQAENKSLKEELALMDQRVLNMQEDINTLTSRLEESNSAHQNCLNEKHDLVVENEQLKQRIKTLEAALSEGSMSITVGEFFKLLWNQSITIKRK